jgi:hypothetical protein
MVRGFSGRIVLEVDRDMRQALYAVLSRENLTLKSWFVGRARAYLREHAHPSVLLAAEPPTPTPVYGARREDR